MINSAPMSPASSTEEEDSVDAIVRSGPRGALAVAGVATASAPRGPERTMSSTESSSAVDDAGGVGSELIMMATQLRGAARSSFACRADTAVPRLPQEVRI
jgi:hypothetical protein